jgi:hypothetical protein
MKHKTRTEPGHMLISLVDDKSLERLNKMFGTHYTRENVKNMVRVARKEEGFNFFDKLMRKGSRSRI